MVTWLCVRTRCVSCGSLAGALGLPQLLCTAVRGLACIAHAFDTFARCSDPEKQVPATLFGTPMRNTVNEGLLPKAS